MAVIVQVDLMATGNWSVDLDPTLVNLSDLAREDGTARDHHLLVWDTLATPEALTYPPLVLRRVTPGAEGLAIGGVGPLWHTGHEGVGPRITYREFISGANILSNGEFDRGEEYWVKAQDSGWVLGGGLAVNAGGLSVDDVLEFDRKFGTIPGHAYRLTASGVSGAGSLRVRILFEGRFNPPNLLPDPLFAGGGWALTDGLVSITPGAGADGTNALTFGPIPKPQLIANSEFDDATGWTLGPAFFIGGGGLVALANPQPQYIGDPGFETGAGWTPSIGPPSNPMSPDITIVNNPGEAKSGSWVMKVGPVTQHQVFRNADFGEGHSYWYPSSTDAEPHSVWEVDETEGNDGTRCLRTTGWSTAGRPGPETIKYLRVDPVEGGGGPETSPVRPGEQYFLEAYFKAAPGSEGQALISVMIPHPTVPGHDVWFHSSQRLNGVDMSDLRWARATISNLTIPSNRFAINALVEIRNHGLGYWYLDRYTMTRTQGNRAETISDTSYPVVANTGYELAALVRAGGDMQVGSVRLGVMLTGPGKDPLPIDIDKGFTDYVYAPVTVSVRPPTGYDTATPFIAGLDIIGESWVDNIIFTKVENNTDVARYAPVPVIEDQRYLLECEVTCINATRGSVAVGVTLSGPDVADYDIEVTTAATGDITLRAIPPTEVRPAPGYTTASLYVRSTDVEGGTFLMDRPKLTKMDNNTATSAGGSVTVTPQRSYRWTEYVRSGPNLQRGTVKLVATCVRAGFDPVVFDSVPMESTANERKVIEHTFTPPSGYAQVDLSIVGTDIEGDNWYVSGGEMRDVDTGTVVFDALSTPDPSGASPFVDAVAPEGAESVRASVIVMAGTSSWSVGAATLARTGVALSTAADIAAELLTDPQTGAPLSVLPGIFDADQVIPYDWTARNLTDRAALHHLVDVVAAPSLEFKINAALPPTMDLSPFPFVDHAPGSDSPVVYRPRDLDVISLPRIESNTETRADVIEVIGAELQTVSGRPFLVTARALVPGASERGIDNQPRALRTKQVHLGTVEHVGYAQARADALAAQEAEPPLSVTAVLNEIDDDLADELGVDARPPTDVGDYVYAWDPANGLRGGPEYATTISGEVVFPRRVRLLSRVREHASVGAPGSRYRLEMLRSDGTTFPLTGVVPSDADVTTITIGDRFLPWEADPQGRDEIEQWAEDRASRPR